MFNPFKKKNILHISTPRDNPNLGYVPPIILSTQDILNACKYHILFQKRYTIKQNNLYQNLQLNYSFYIHSYKSFIEHNK